MAELALNIARSSSISPPVFSSDAPQPSSPPSSPPGFPWEQNQHNKDEAFTPQKPSVLLKSPPKTAFSLLGKRKPLEPVADNVRHAKRVSRKQTKPENKPALTQLQISLGQRVQTTCTVCGMEYVASSAEDRKLHDVYHRQQTEGYDVGKDFVRKARDVGSVFEAPEGQEGDAICAVDCIDTAARRKRAQAVLEMAQRDLGAVAINEKELWSRRIPRRTNADPDASKKKDVKNPLPRYTAYMYIRDTKCVGLLLAERITEAYPVIGPTIEAKATSVPPRSSEEKTGGSALSALRARRKAEGEAKLQMEVEEKKADDRPLELSKTPQSASLGIARIWTSPTHRRQNVASSLLDAACQHWGLVDNAEGIEGDRMNQVAFSQPTALGTKLARRWSGKRIGWLVYIE